jgi:hypothetical protein
LIFNYFIAGLTKKNLLYLSLVTLFGVTFDLVINLLGIFSLNFEYYIWLPAIWLLFSNSLLFSFKKIFKLSNVFVFFLGAVGGPFSYWTAGQLNIVYYPVMIREILLHSFLWGLLLIFFKKIGGKNEN